jgi:hypothetical protein
VKISKAAVSPRISTRPWCPCLSRFVSFSKPEVTCDPQARPARPSLAERSPYSTVAWLPRRFRVTAKVLLPTGPYRPGTVNVAGVSSKLTRAAVVGVQVSTTLRAGGAGRVTSPPGSGTD